MNENGVIILSFSSNKRLNVIERRLVWKLFVICSRLKKGKNFIVFIIAIISFANYNFVCS